MLEQITEQEIGLRLLCAVVCATVIGLEREVKHKNVGLRTYLLVCLGSAGFTLLIINSSAYFMSLGMEVDVSPSRIVQGIVTGLGFLGGGAILQKSNNVSGVATGAGIWISGAIGIACGFGFYAIAFILTAITFLVLGVLGTVRAKLRGDMEADQGDD